MEYFPSSQEGNMGTLSTNTVGNYDEFDPEQNAANRDARVKELEGNTNPNVLDESNTNKDENGISAEMDEFDRIKQERLQTESESNPDENGELQVDHPDAAPAPRAEFEPEAQPESEEAQPESKAEPEFEPELEIDSESEFEPKIEAQDERQENREKTRAEQRLDSLREQIETINKEIEENDHNKESSEKEISRCEKELGRNRTEHEEISDTLDELKKEVKETRRSLFTSFATGFKLLKNQLFGDNEKIRGILKEANDYNDKNEKAKASQKETEDKLEANEEEKNRLDNDYEKAVDGRNDCIKKRSRLERQKADANKRLALLEEEVAEEKEREAWNTARQEVRSEMDSNNPRLFRRELDASQRSLDAELAEDLDELESKYINPPELTRIDRMMLDEKKIEQIDEERARNKVRSKEIAERLRQEHAAKTAAINQQRERVEQYFPTLPERIRDIRENDRVNKALGSLKRKILMRVYGIS